MEQRSPYEASQKFTSLYDSQSFTLTKESATGPSPEPDASSQRPIAFSP
jgi:hypothetical protein